MRTLGGALIGSVATYLIGVGLPPLVLAAMSVAGICLILKFPRFSGQVWRRKALQ